MIKTKNFKASAKTNPQVASYLAAAERGNKSQHVIPRDGQWIVKQSLSTNIFKYFSTQKEAIAYAKQNAKAKQADLFVHNKKGEIRERSSY